MTKTDLDELANRSTPKEFEAAVWRAWAALTVTTDEACAAFDYYLMVHAPRAMEALQ